MSEERINILMAISVSDFNAYGCPDVMCDDGRTVMHPEWGDTYTSIVECWCCERYFAVVRDGLPFTTIQIPFEDPAANPPERYGYMPVSAHPTRVPR
ncbi:MAG: hypothetical protein U9Q03_03455 [Patescibacteria group bacterium]|nr:hypothetical protein [Patescibacteria group bacterium]